METFNAAIDKHFNEIKTINNNANTQVSLLINKNNNKKVVRIKYTGKPDIYKILLNVKHENLPIIYDVYVDGNQVTVIEEFIDGITLDSMLQSQLYTEKATINTIIQLCNVLQVLHNMNIVHRDIKPENIMISSNGVLKLIDFHSSRINAPTKDKDTQVLGTVGYAAPEQFGFAQSDNKTDIYSIGILMNVMLTGEHPAKRYYEGKLKSIIEKCIRIDPNMRYNNIESLLERLNKG